MTFRNDYTNIFNVEHELACAVNNGRSISNPAYGSRRSAAMAVMPNTNYDLYTLVRGEIDGDGRMGYYQLRAYYYDSGGQYISYQTAVSRAEGTLTSTCACHSLARFSPVLA